MSRDNLLLPIPLKIQRALFCCLLLVCMTPWVGAGAALLFGAVFAIVFGNPFAALSNRSSKWLLKIAVVGLGFSVSIDQVVAVGKASFWLTLVSITAVLGLGELLRQSFKVERNTGLLISFGTAICGGSAIAAMAPVIKAKDHEIALSLAVVFFLNALGLWLFPLIGHALGLTEQQFGLWAALGIHDTSSVVGAGAAYGTAALAIATTVKLTRAMWIIPYTLAAGAFFRTEEKISIPLFIVGFVLAACINTWLPEYQVLWHGLHELAKRLLVVCLFLIGTGMSISVLKKMGVKPLIMAVSLWFVVSGVLLVMILDGYIHADF